MTIYSYSLLLSFQEYEYDVLIEEKPWLLLLYIGRTIKIVMLHSRRNIPLFVYYEIKHDNDRLLYSKY